MNDFLKNCFLVVCIITLIYVLSSFTQYYWSKTDTTNKKVEITTQTIDGTTYLIATYGDNGVSICKK